MVQDTTLLTPQDAVQAGPGDRHLSAALLAPAIRPTEEDLFNTRFGWAFYERLKADRWAYRLQPEGQVTPIKGVRYYAYFDPATTVPAAQFVLHDGTVYRAVREVPPGVYPGNADYYQAADRFRTDCYEILWRNYLRGILALAVARAGVFTRTYREGERGAVKRHEEGKSTVLRVAEVSALKAEMLGDLERSIANMEQHIRRTKGSCFTDYARLTDGEGCDADATGPITQRSAPRRRAYGFTLQNSPK